MARKSAHVWTLDELAIMRQLYPVTKTQDIADRFGMTAYQVYRKATALGLRKSDEYLRSPAACRLRHGDEVGKAYRFEKGHVPANKGKKGFYAPGSEKGWFAKGAKPHTWLPIGSERICPDGYLRRKLTDTGYTPRDWVPVHHILWRDAGREIPKGFRLTFKDRNKSNITLDNLELVSIADMMRRNSFRNYGPEIAQLVHLRGKINQVINRRIRNGEQ